MDLFDLGIEPVVLADCCASTMSLQAHLAGLAVLNRHIGPHQIRDAGFGGGYIAAPDEAHPNGEAPFGGLRDGSDYLGRKDRPEPSSTRRTPIPAALRSRTVILTPPILAPRCRIKSA